MLRKVFIASVVIILSVYLLSIRHQPRLQRTAVTASGTDRKAQDIHVPGYKGERIIYDISPLGRAEYNDLGLIRLDGQRVRLATFRTQAFGFDDTERVYSDPATGLPVRVERDISMWGGREDIVEEYDQNNFALNIRKLKKGKTVKEQLFKADGPINNAVILPFSLRNIPELKVGWSMVVRFPHRFEIKLISVEDIEAPAGKFKAYHFTSIPNKFEIWISADQLRLPIKIKGLEGLGYTMTLRERGILEE